MLSNKVVVSVALSAAISTIPSDARGAGGTGTPQAQPYLCQSSSDGSSSSFVNNGAGKLVLYVNLASPSSTGGAILSKFTPPAASKSTFSVSSTYSTASQNLAISLAVQASTGTFVVSPTSASLKNGFRTWNFDFTKYNPPAGSTIKNLAVIVSVNSGTSGNVFITKYVLNGAEITKKVMTTAGCLQLN